MSNSDDDPYADADGVLDAESLVDSSCDSFVDASADP